MSSVRIQTGDTERIEVLILDGSLDPITGKTDILISIRRISDGYWYDFDDDTFKNSGWTDRQEAMTETDSTNDQGVYHYDFDTSAITNAATDDTYEIRVDQSPGTDAANVPMTGEIKVGAFIDDLDSPVSEVVNDILDAVIDTHGAGNITVKNALQVICAMLPGLTTGGGTATEVFKNPSGTKNRVILTYDGSNNRLTATFDFS
jgi:hypothetical protein